MDSNDLLCILTAILLPVVQRDMPAKTDLLDAIRESARYAADIVEEVGNLDDGDDPDGEGEPVEIIPPSRRHA